MAKDFLYVDSTTGFNTEATGYETADFISTSAGAADAGKPIVLDAGGKLDASFIDDADIDHGNLTGLADDDHVIYLLASGARAVTGDMSMSGNQLTNVGDPTSATIDAASSDAVSMSFLASTTLAEGASTIGINDVGGYYTANNVEAALQEVFAAIPGTTSMTVGAGGVTAGDAVYISASNTVLPLTTLTQDHFVIGLAKTTQAAASTVAIAGNDSVLPGVLTGATAGSKQYWVGTGYSTSIPGTANNNVWRVGIAKNSTDLYVEVDHIRKNN